MSKIHWKGVYPVVVTPFDQEGNIQEESLREMVRALIVEDQVHGMVAAASTGEYYVMTPEERLRVFEIVKETADTYAKKGFVLIANATNLYTEDVIRTGNTAARMGYDGALVLPPSYATPSHDQIVRHYQKIGAGLDMPIMLYNAPKWTGIDFNTAFLEELLKIDSIVALKESSRNVEQLLEILRLYGDRLAVFVGLETLILPAMALGADGVVAMAVQAKGSPVMDLYRACREGRWEDARALQYRVSKLYRYGTFGTHYAALKEVINQTGRPAGYPRSPLTLPDDAGKKAISRMLAELGMAHAEL